MVCNYVLFGLFRSLSVLSGSFLVLFGVYTYRNFHVRVQLRLQRGQGEAWPSFREYEGVFISFKRYSPADQGCQPSVNLRTVRKKLTQNDLSVKFCKNIWMFVKNEKISTKLLK